MNPIASIDLYYPPNAMCFLIAFLNRISLGSIGLVINKACSQKCER